MTSVCQAIIDLVQTPPETSTCVDCGGVAHLLTPPREDGVWMVGDVITYRCSDCRDRWDIILESDDV
jgi:hypothetical protein